MSTPPLFREEAKESLKVRLEGDVVAYTPPSMRKLALALLATAVVAGVFASTATYTRYASATGVLAPRAGLESTKAQAAASKRYLEQQRKLIESGFLASSGAIAAERMHLGILGRGLDVKRPPGGGLERKCEITC